MRTFLSPRRRTHRIDWDHKFVGGRLVVSDEVAPEIEAYARAHPEIGITWVLVDQENPPSDTTTPKPKKRPSATVVDGHTTLTDAQVAAGFQDAPPLVDEPAAPAGLPGEAAEIPEEQE